MTGKQLCHWIDPVSDREFNGLVIRAAPLEPFAYIGNHLQVAFALDKISRGADLRCGFKYLSVINN